MLMRTELFCGLVGWGYWRRKLLCRRRKRREKGKINNKETEKEKRKENK
jgi:hypothetical protein